MRAGEKERRIQKGFPKISDLQITEQPPENDAADILPPTVNRIAAMLWIALFGTRGIVIPLLIAEGILSAPDAARWDGGILLQIYLVLLVFTALIAVLRLVRGSHPASPNLPSSDQTPSPARRGKRRD